MEAEDKITVIQPPEGMLSAARAHKYANGPCKDAVFTPRTDVWAILQTVKDSTISMYISVDKQPQRNLLIVLNAGFVYEGKLVYTLEYWDTNK